MHDLHSNVRVLRVVAPVAIGTTGTGQVGKVIDRQGYGGVEFIFSYGTVTATNAVYTATIFHGDVTGTLTSVADGDLRGTEALAGIAAGTPRTSGVNKNVSKRVGYAGNKRYVSASVKSTITATTPVSVNAVLFSPEHGPTSNP